MNKNLSTRLSMPLLAFAISLAMAALAGSIATMFAGIFGTLLAFIFAALAGITWNFLKTRLDARKALFSNGEGSASKEVPADRLDALTGLANINGLNAWFAEKSARLASDNKAIIVLTADLANFDQLVKTKGIEEANSVLKEAAKRVSSFTGEDGVAARIEGDEFAAIATVVPSRSLELAAEQAGKLTEMLQRPVELPTGVVWIGGSVGAATGNPQDGLVIFEKAKAALKKAKQLGRGHYFVDGVSDK